MQRKNVFITVYYTFISEEGSMGKYASALRVVQ